MASPKLLNANLRLDTMLMFRAINGQEHAVLPDTTRLLQLFQILFGYYVIGDFRNMAGYIVGNGVHEDLLLDLAGRYSQQNALSSFICSACYFFIVDNKPGRTPNQTESNILVIQSELEQMNVVPEIIKLVLEFLRNGAANPVGYMERAVMIGAGEKLVSSSNLSVMELLKSLEQERSPAVAKDKINLWLLADQAETKTKLVELINHLQILIDVNLNSWAVPAIALALFIFFTEQKHPDEWEDLFNKFIHVALSNYAVGMYLLRECENRHKDTVFNLILLICGNAELVGEG